MKKIISFFLLSSILLNACKEKNQKKSIKEKNIIQKKHKQKSEVIVRYFPKEKDTIKLDTIFPHMNLQVILENSYTDSSYVKNRYEGGEGIIYEDRYLNANKHVQIKLSDKILVDTVFFKESFLKNKEFIEIANFHGYWFRGANSQVVDFFGTICKPDTDWCYNFYHYYDLKEKRFVMKEYIESEEMEEDDF